MIDGPAPIELLRRLEKACEGEPADEIIFCMGVVMGRLIVHTAHPEDYQEVLQACLNAILAGINARTEH